MKIVSENMEEFKRIQKSKPALGVGAEEMIRDWLDSKGIYKYELDGDLKIHLFQPLDLQNGSYDDKPEFIDFAYAASYFNISSNNIVSLDGCPDQVGGYFFASQNKLKSLEGGPRFVGGNFNVSRNNLTSLDGFPAEIGGSVSIGDNDVQFFEEEIRDICKVSGSIYTEVSHLFD